MNWQQTIARLSTLSVGGFFTDHAGRKVRRLDEFNLEIGPGYNGIVTVAYYLDAVRDGAEYGKYLVL